MKKSVITAALLLMPVLSGLAAGVQETALARATRLFAGRDNPDSLKQSLAIAEDLRSKEPGNYEAVYRVAMYKYYLADREPDKTRRQKIYEAAIEAAKKAVELDGSRVEGHFWLAANEGEYADLKGALSALSLVKALRKEFEAALAIDPAYENGAAYLALGRMDLELPRLLGGSDARGLSRLEDGYKACPTNAELKLALGEVYEKKGRKDDARQLYESVLSTVDAARSPNELADLRTKARQHLDKLK